MSTSIPIKHHYIPKFLLRPFCFDDERLHYYDKNANIELDRKIEEAFMERNLYRDVVNNPDDPVKLEHVFAKFEGEVSKIIARLRTEDEILLLREDEDKLKLFLALMSFRSAYAGKEFSENANEVFKAYYSSYDKLDDLNAFWKKNLEAIAGCRSLREVFDSKDIADPIKIFMFRDTESFFGFSFSIAERRGREEFVLGDALPTRVSGQFPNGGELPMFSFFPISPDRVLISVTNLMVAAPNWVFGFNKDLFKMPHYGKSHSESVHRINKVYEEDVKKLNSITVDSSTGGFVFKSRECVSLEKYDDIYKAWKESKNSYAL